MLPTLVGLPPPPHPPNLNMRIAKNSGRRKLLFLSLLKIGEGLASQLVGKNWEGGQGKKSHRQIIHISLGS